MIYKSYLEYVALCRADLNAQQEVGDLEEAEAHCLRLLDYGAPSKERAKALLREIHALQVGTLDRQPREIFISLNPFLLFS